MHVPLADGTVFQDVWSNDAATFEVQDGGKVYIGPLAPNSVRHTLSGNEILRHCHFPRIVCYRNNNATKLIEVVYSRTVPNTTKCIVDVQ
jgi:hypothetical protein